MIMTGSYGGAEVALAAGGTKNMGNVASAKLSWPALIPAIVPVIWLGSSVMLFAEKPIAAGPAKGVAPPEPPVVVIDPLTTTETSWPTAKLEAEVNVRPLGSVKPSESMA